MQLEFKSFKLRIRLLLLSLNTTPCLDNSPLNSRNLLKVLQLMQHISSNKANLSQRKITESFSSEHRRKRTIESTWFQSKQNSTNTDFSFNNKSRMLKMAMMDSWGMTKKLSIFRLMITRIQSSLRKMDLCAMPKNKGLNWVMLKECNRHYCSISNSKLSKRNSR